MTKLTADWLSSKNAQRACGILTDAGYQAYFVGGCVRNTLLGSPVNDLDIATDARPERVMELANATGLRAIPTGIDHGTVTVIEGGEPFEITTFRRDVDTDGRRAVVAFSDRIEDDASRRDFTMNALYATAEGELVDPLGGLPDLQARHVRFILDPVERIQEDYLRILRFFRFYAWYGDPADGIDPEGLAACATNLDGIESLSAERITQEVRKLLSAADPAPAVAAMAASGALGRVIPGAAPDVLTVLVHVEHEADLAPDPMRRLAALGGERDRLRLSKQESNQLALILSDMSAPELAYRHGHDVAVDKLAVEAASLGQPIASDSLTAVSFAADQTLPVSAADFMPALTGPELGRALKDAEARWIASGFKLSKAQLLD